MFRMPSKRFKFNDEDIKSEKKIDTIKPLEPTEPISPMGPQSYKEENSKEENFKEANIDKLAELLQNKEEVQSDKEDKVKEQIIENINDSKNTKSINEVNVDNNSIKNEPKVNILNIDEQYELLSKFDYVDSSDKFYFLLENMISSTENISDEQKEFFSEYIELKNSNLFHALDKNKKEYNYIDNYDSLSGKELSFIVIDLINDVNYLLNISDFAYVAPRRVKRYRKIIAEIIDNVIEDSNRQEKKALKYNNKNKKYIWKNKVCISALKELQSICRKISKKIVYDDDEENINNLLNKMNELQNLLQNDKNKLFLNSVSSKEDISENEVSQKKDTIEIVKQNDFHDNLSGENSLSINDEVNHNKDNCNEDNQDDVSLNNNKKETFKKFVGIIVVIAIVLSTIAIGSYFYMSYSHRIVENKNAFNIELGETLFPTKSQFFLEYPSDMKMDASNIDTTKTGTYKLTTEDKFNGKKTYTVVVKDTTKPEVSLKYSVYQVRKGTKINPEDLIDTVVDNDVNGNLEYFLSQDKFTDIGTYDIILTVVDKSGNETNATQRVEVVNQWVEDLKHVMVGNN